MTALAVFLFLIALFAVLFILRAIRIGSRATLGFIFLFLAALALLISVLSH